MPSWWNADTSGLDPDSVKGVRVRVSPKVQNFKKINKMKGYDQHKMKRTQIRQDQLNAGFFDGRFVSRSEKPKNLYTRKTKHKKDLFV